jgi:tetratricopeptide (TPR) repeat protein
MLLALCLMALPQGSAVSEWYTLHRQPGQQESLISANKLGVTAESALHRLARRMSWKLATESEFVDQKLGQVSLDLAFTRQPARVVAHLIAAAAGLDVAFDDSGSRTEMHVISAPTTESESGRARLRNWAIHWYKQFLTEDPVLANSPIVQEKGLEALMHLGKLMLQVNDLEGAVKVYNRVFEADDSQVYVPMSLLRLTEAHFELAMLSDMSEGKRRAHLRMAEEAALKLTRMNPRLKPTAQATVLLGRIMMAEQRHSECIKTLEAHSLRLSNTPEIIDIYLLIAECYSHGELPERVIQALDILEKHRSYKQWNRRQWLDYHYLRGLGAEAHGHALRDPETRKARFGEAMQALEWFLGVGKDDRRRGQAFVVLGRAYLELGKFLEARAASLEAMLEKHKLDLEWLQAARILEARSALALGETETALTKLELVVRPNPERMPQLVLYLVRTLMEVGRFDRSISNADLLANQTGPWGDQARVLRIEAMYRQASTADTMQGFPAAAIQIAKRIEDKQQQQKVAEIIGSAYEGLNQIERAAEAYRGILK